MGIITASPITKILSLRDTESEQAKSNGYQAQDPKEPAQSTGDCEAIGHIPSLS